MKNAQSICTSCGITYINKSSNGRSLYCSQHCKDLRKKNAPNPRPEKIVIYDRYMKSAIKRNKSFQLSLEQFDKLWQKPCYYCNAPIQTIGIDRMNNNEGYYPGNIVPCCTECNLMKRGMSTKAFIYHCKLIIKQHS